jgi:hypothetical protein
MLVHDRKHESYTTLEAPSSKKRKATAEDREKVARAIHAADSAESDDLYDEMAEAALRAMGYEVETS